MLIHSGPFIFDIHSPVAIINENLSRLYNLSSKAGNPSPIPFVDFHVSITPLKSVFNFYSDKAQFCLDNRRVFNPFPLGHSTAMLEWGMNWCLSTQIHTYLIIHAAVIEKNGFAAVFPAPPGSGKSTLCASLVLEGWRLLSDELTLINLSTAEVVPVPRPIGLKNESIDIIKQRYPQAIFGVLSSDTLKGSVCHLKPPLESVNRQFNECPIGWIIFPKFEIGADTQLTNKPKGQAFLEIAENAFNYSLLGLDGFNVLKKAVDQAGCFSFKYSNLDEAIAVFDQLDVLREI